VNFSFRYIITIVVCLIVTSAQSQSLTEYYKELHGSVEGCKTYHGQLDEIFPLEMLICGDNGVYKMYSSSDVYNLTIENEGDIMELVEEDSQGRTSGYITVTKSVSNNQNNVFTGEWKHIESAARYPFAIQEYGQKIQLKANYITRLSGVLRSRLVEVDIDHANQSVEIREKFGLQGRYNSQYECQDEKCKRFSIKPEGIIGVSSVEIYKKAKGGYGMVVFSSDQNRETSELKLVAQVKSETKAYSDYRSMLLAEYPVFEDEDLSDYIYRMQANWIKSTSINLREILESDPTEIVLDRLKHQASSWIDIELWTEDFISGVQYNQYNWQGEVEVTAFSYNIDKSRAVSLSDVWDDDWSHTQLENEEEEINSAWVVGREALHKIHFDRINGVQRESFPYSQLKENIDRGSWLDKLLDKSKIKN